MKYKVTVCMSNYNQAHFLPQAIESVLKQKTDFDVQLIITDDCSEKDNSVEIIKSYVDKYPNKIIALLNTENGRYLKNILRAKAITKTPYFCLLDADDYWTDENYLQDAVDFLETHPDFTIYSRNVTCLNEEGAFSSYFPLDLGDRDFDIKSYLDDKIVITQMTGTFFRNVIFKDGIPSIMHNAVGTISESFFEGDFGRYLMHLKYGKAHYESRPCGVYRILSTGIWSRLSDFEKNIIQAQCCLDYNEYFECKYEEAFLYKTYQGLKKGLTLLNSMTFSKDISEDIQKKFFNVLQTCSQKRQLIVDYIKVKKGFKKAKLKYKLLLFVYNKLKKKLMKKELIELGLF